MGGFGWGPKSFYVEKVYVFIPSLNFLGFSQICLCFPGGGYFGTNVGSYSFFPILGQRPETHVYQVGRFLPLACKGALPKGERKAYRKCGRGSTTLAGEGSHGRFTFFPSNELFKSLPLRFSGEPHCRTSFGI